MKEDFHQDTPRRRLSARLFCPLCNERKDDIRDLYCRRCDVKVRLWVDSLDLGVPELCSVCAGRGFGYDGFGVMKFVPDESGHIKCTACRGSGFKQAA
jgi:hypothetical protein